MSSIRAALTLSVLTGAGLLPGPASALQIGNPAPVGIGQDIEQVRLVCDAFGRCVRTGPPVVRVLPGVRIGPPAYRGPDYVAPGFGVRRGVGIEREQDFGDRDQRRRMEQGDRGERGGQGMRRRPDEDNGRGRGQMHGDRDEGGQGMRGQGQEMRGQGQGNGQGGQGSRRLQQGGQGGQGERRLQQGGEGGNRGGPGGGDQ